MSDSFLNREFNTNRLEALTDGVFAISMTILVLSIEVPARNQISNQGDLLDHMFRQSYDFFSYLVSFLVIASVWVSSIKRMHTLKKIDYSHLWMSITSLFFVTMIPFTTSLMSDYAEYEFAEILFHGNILILQILSKVQWDHLLRNPHLVDEAISNNLDIDFLKKNSVFLIVVPILGIVASIFTPLWSNMVYVLMLLKIIIRR